MTPNDSDFIEAIAGLKRCDFTRLDPLFAGQPARIVEWFDRGLFDSEPEAHAESLSCACFNGQIEVARLLLDNGVSPAGRMGTGMNAFHWAANRGQIEVVRLLIERGAPLEIENMYGGTVLGATVWSAIHQPNPNQVAVIELLLQAGAKIEQAGYPSGHAEVDEVLRRYGAGA